LHKIHILKTSQAHVFPFNFQKSLTVPLSRISTSLKSCDLLCIIVDFSGMRLNNCNSNSLIELPKLFR